MPGREGERPTMTVPAAQGSQARESATVVGRGSGDVGDDQAFWRSKTAIGTAVYLVAVVAVLFGGSQFTLYEGTLIATYGIVTVAQDWIFGRAGLVSLGPAAIMAVGAFTTARLSTEGWGVFPVPLLISFVFGGVIGLLIGIPGLRFRGLYLMLTTLALQFIISFAAEQYQGVNREAGFTVIPPSWGSLQLANPQPLFLISVILLGLVLLGLSGIHGGAPGRAWNAIRQNEAAASVLGINLVRWKLAAFIGSSAVIAAAGSVYAYQIGQVQYTTFSLDLSLTLVVMVFIGGVGTLIGPIIGAVGVVLLPQGIQEISNLFSGMPSVSGWLQLNEGIVADGIYGLLLLLLLIFERGGLVAVGQRLGRGAVAAGRLAVRASAPRIRRTDAPNP